MEPKFDACRLIEHDLEATQRARRRHFAPALVLALLLVGGTALLLGVRDDLFAQPPALVVMDLLLWPLSLGVLPAIGLGMWFPSTRVRVAVAAATLGLATATTIWRTDLVARAWTQPGDATMNGCTTLVLAAGVALIGLGVLSGAFVQRRAASSTLWFVAGLSLASLHLIGWICPDDGYPHVLGSHVGGAAVLIALATVVAMAAHRRARRSDEANDAR